MTHINIYHTHSNHSIYLFHVVFPQLTTVERDLTELLDVCGIQGSCQGQVSNLTDLVVVKWKDEPFSIKKIFK